MAKEYAKGFYNSSAWKRTRNAYYSFRRGQCERCKAEYEEGKRSLAEINPGSIVHHKEYITPDNLSDPTIALSFENLELLCRSCHELEHKGIKRRYSVNPDGSIAPLDLVETEG